MTANERKVAFQRAKRTRKLDINALTKQFEVGASPSYTGEPFVRVLVAEDVQEPVEFEPYEAVPEAPVHIGELQHTPIRD